MTHWAIVASLVATAKLNGIERLLPWTWKAEQLPAAANA
jgi:hypothetical protein